MRASIQDLIRAVSDTLTNQVLPELEQASWTASHVRACAMLLLFAEDRVTSDRSLLLDTNATMRKFLESVFDGRACAPKGLIASAGVEKALSEFAQIPAEAEVDLLTRANEAYKVVLMRLTRKSSEMRVRAGASDDSVFRGGLRECLASIHEREAKLAVRANLHLPL